MAALVTLVACLVQLYSLAYLADETPPALGRYYLYQSLFAFSMLGLVFAPNFLQLFVFWELVGLCSYLLIGFYYQRPAAARAAVKAFWVTKLGDVGFLLGIVLLWGRREPSSSTRSSGRWRAAPCPSTSRSTWGSSISAPSARARSSRFTSGCPTRWRARRRCRR